MNTSKLSLKGKTDRSSKILRFGLIALVVMIVNMVLNFYRGLPVSAFLTAALIFIFGIILLLIYNGYTKGALTAIVLTVNAFIVMLAFAEGLKAGGYLFLLPLLFAVAFLMSLVEVLAYEIFFYFFITIGCFCVCILFCKPTSNWQHISENLYTGMFAYNSICVVMLCSIFAGVGIYFEKQHKSALHDAKNKAELQEQKIKIQNDHLHHIAFMNAHIVRSPLANILALVKLIDMDKIPDTDNQELLQMLKTSAQQLDNNIQEIVSKATDKAVV